MSEAPMQVIVAAFSSPDRATQVLDDLKQGKKAGLLGLVDAAAIVKDADGSRVSGVLLGDESVYPGDTQLTDEQPVDERLAAAATTDTNPVS